METQSRHWTTGDRVVVRATTCTIAAVERLADCAGLRLSPHVAPDVPFGILLVPFDRPRRVDLVHRPRAMRPRRWLHAVRRAAARHHPFGGLRHAARAKIDLLPYQLEPALAILRHGCLRVLLADAVGLGKTIQAALVLSEVLDVDSSRRALVIAPAGLRDQWHSELSSHFDVDAAVCDAAWLRRRTRDLPPDTNPWALPGTYLVSFDFIKQPEVVSPIERLLWDIVVVDEAHLVTSGTDRRTAVDAIASRARRVMLLTGTPHSGDEAQFEALCGIGAGLAPAPLVMFRRRRTDVGLPASRRSVLLRVRLSAIERRMHELLDHYTSRVWRESHARGDRIARLVPIVLRKRALSSAGSLAASLARRIDLLSGADRDNAQQLALPIYEDDVDDAVRDEVLGAPGLANAALERRWLGTLLQVARRAATDERKIACLRRYLSRVKEPVIVFTEYRDTLARLQQALHRHSLPVNTLHGGMTRAERRAVQRAFDEHDCLLLATDAAAEGLNLQRRCRVVVHFELPWNPLRLEQRTGRVDRIGQTRRVHEVALVADDTAERVVLAPLARRARRAREVAPSGGRMLELLSEAQVGEAIVTGRADGVLELPRVTLPGTDPLFTSEAAAEAARLNDVRRSLSSELGTPPAEGGPAVTLLERRDGCDTSAITLVYALSLVSAEGDVAHTEPLTLAFECNTRHSARSVADSLRLLQRLLAEKQPAIDSLIDGRFTAITREVIPLHRTAMAGLAAREAAIGQLHTSPARDLVQAGLFDRRALRLAEAEHAADRQRREDAEAGLKAVAAAGVLTRRVTLEAALLRIGRHV